MLHIFLTRRLRSEAGSRNGRLHARDYRIARACLPAPTCRSGISTVPRLDLIVVLVIAAASAAITASATGHFEPLPLLAGVIIAGVLRSVRLARERG